MDRCTTWTLREGLLTIMHKTSPAPCKEGATRGAASSSFRQMALIAHLDAFAHLEDDLQAVVHEACRAAADGIGVGHAWVLQHRADEGAFVLQAGVGWPAEMIGRMRVAADPGTTAGLAWLTGQLIQFRQLDEIKRIRMPEVLVGRGVHRMVSVPIQGECQKAFGVLEVGSTETGEFTRHDLAFLQGMANSVALAVGLHASRMQQAEPVVERRAARAGRLDVASGRQGPAGTRYQQDARVGAS